MFNLAELFTFWCIVLFEIQERFYEVQVTVAF